MGLGGITVGAGLSLAYGYDYRAAARITAKLQGYTLDAARQEALMARAKEIHEGNGTLPQYSQADRDVFNASREALAALLGKEVKDLPQPDS